VHRSSRRAAALSSSLWGVALLALLASCQTEPAKPAASHGDSGAPELEEADCTVEALPPQQLRLLTRREYAATVEELFDWFRTGGAAHGSSTETPVVESCDGDADCELLGERCDEGTCATLPCGTVAFALPWEDGIESVVVAGDFNDWSPTAAEGGWPLEWRGDLGHWLGRHEVDEGTWRYKLVVDGVDWRVDPHASATEADGYGGENAVLTVSCDEEADGEAPERLGPPDVTPVQDFPVETREDHHLFDNSVAGALVTTPRASAFFEASTTLAQQLVAARASVLPCSDAELRDVDCVERMVGQLGRRIYRRPLGADERERYRSRITMADDPVVGLERVLRTMLASPHFLYRSELGTETAPGIATLDDHELASLLSYTIWGSAPDDALLDDAEAGRLSSGPGRAEVARRMMDDPRAAARLEWFGAQWLGVDKLTTAHKATERYPLWSDALREAMIEESGRRVTGELLDGEGTLPGLLTTSRTELNAELAAVYGVEPPAEGWSRAVLPPERAGVLGMAAVLASTSHSDQTSPVRRGLWVRERLLCQDLGTPPANAGGVPELEEGLSTRDRFAQHSTDPACSGCHQYIDPVGFGFEHFDPIGAWREADDGGPVDASGSVVGLEGIGGMDEVGFYGADELARIVASSDAAPACFVETTWAWTLGRAPQDACTLAQSTEAFRAAGQDYRTLVEAVVASPTFAQRRIEP
jgi:hypothetical protein